MNLKNLLRAFMIMCAFTLSVPSFANAGPGQPAANETSQKIEARIMEIHRMDKTDLSKAEKKELRKEVKQLRKQAKTQGVYLSVGAIIIIILLLILLL